MQLPKHTISAIKLPLHTISSAIINFWSNVNVTPFTVSSFELLKDMLWQRRVALFSLLTIVWKMHTSKSGLVYFLEYWYIFNSVSYVRTWNTFMYLHTYMRTYTLPFKNTNWTLIIYTSICSMFHLHNAGFSAVMHLIYCM